MNILTKLGFGACVVFGVLSGGYYLTDLRANEAARLAVEAFKKDFEASVPSSTVDIGKVTANAFDKEAIVQDFSIRVGESAKISSEVIVLALKDGKIYSSEFRNISFKGYLSKNENIEGKADSLIIKGFDVVHIKSIAETLLANPQSVPNQIDRLAFTQIKIEGIRFELFYKGRPELELKPSSFDLVGVKNSKIEKLVMAGALEASKHIFAKDRMKFLLGNLTLEKFDFSKIVTALLYNSQRDLLVGLSDGFDLNSMEINDFSISDGEHEAYLASGKIAVSNAKKSQS